MSDFITEVTDASFDHDVLASTTTVLVDLWAPWCAPCRALAPILSKLSLEYQGKLQIAKVNVEKYPEIQRRFSVRGIPTMILFRDGAEAARLIGGRNIEEMRRWLSREGVQAPSDPPLRNMAAAEAAPWGAFYGDADLKDFLVKRLKARAAATQIKVSRTPYWADGTGTISAALVSSADARILEGITGMPASFACALEFCIGQNLQPEQADALVGRIPLGADLRKVAPQMMLKLLDGSMGGDWCKILGDPALDALRLRWMDLVTLTTEGKEVRREEWNALLAGLQALRSDGQTLEREVHDALISALAALSPLPPADDGTAWTHGMLFLSSYLKYVLATSAQGWGAEEFGFERLRHTWFSTREKSEPGGTFNESSLAAAREDWLNQYGDRQRKHAAFFDAFETNMAPVNDKASACLLELLASAPIVRQA